MMQRQSSIAFEGINSYTPISERLSAKYIKSFAYYTIKDRLPVILTKVINELATNKVKIIKKYGEAAEEDLKSVIGQISKLKNEVVTNKCLIKLCSKGDDIPEWNEYLQSQSELNTPCWYYSPWLYVECYMYRRLQEIFENSETLQDLDPFTQQKEDAFQASISEIKAVGKMTLNILCQINSIKQELKENFIGFLKLCLWSNRCDLSLLKRAETSEEDCDFKAINGLNPFLVCDDSLEVFEFLSNHSNGVIDFVNDNSSYEIFSDFCFCDFLCTSSLASKIRFHIKKMPWFVSDAMRKDVIWLLKKLEEEGLEKLSNRWKKYIQDGTWCLYEENYWTLPFDYSEMKARDLKLYNFLSQSNLVIFKGDLNYRKLLSDINWDHCEKFETVLKNFKPTNILSLRTVKADLICGLSLEKKEEFSKKESSWMHTGEYALIQFYNHIKCY